MIGAAESPYKTTAMIPSSSTADMLRFRSTGFDIQALIAWNLA